MSCRGDELGRGQPDATRAELRRRGVKALLAALSLGVWIPLAVGLLAACQGEDIAALPEARTPPSVLLISPDQSELVAVRDFLLPYRFASIGMHHTATVGTPTLAQLAAYDAVLTWTDASPPDPVGLGNVLADYVDQGGGVAIGTFGYYNPSFDVEGRITTVGYSPLVSAATNAYANGTMGPPLVPGHPILAGVGSIGAYFRDDATPAAGAVVLATWAGGTVPTVAVNATGTVVGLTLWPAAEPSITASSNTGDHHRLMANVLHFLSGW